MKQENLLDVDEQDLTEFFKYLDDLRESGVTNMFGAARYLEKDFDLTRTHATGIALLWMETFDGKASVESRVQSALSPDWLCHSAT